MTITGTPREDEVLTANTDAIDDEDGIGTYTYQWQADGVDIAGATNATYTLTQAEVGKVITVVAVHTDALGTVENPITSAATTAVVNVNDETTGDVTITGTPREDEVLITIRMPLMTRMVSVLTPISGKPMAWILQELQTLPIP